MGWGSGVWGVGVGDFWGVIEPLLWVRIGIFGVGFWGGGPVGF